MATLPVETLNWLLENDNPPVRNLTKKFLLSEEISEEELQEVNNYEPIKTILSLMKNDGSWNDHKDPYKKYTGSYWQFIFLCEMHANPNNESIKKAALRILDYQLTDGGFSHKLSFKKPIICLTANILRSLVYFGYIEQESVQMGIDMITNHIIDNQGVVCHDPNYILLSDCQMALTKVLALFATLEAKDRSKNIQKAVPILGKKIAENRVFQYVPTGAKEYKKLIKGKKVAEIRQIKTSMTKNPDNMVKTEEKRSWKKFSFPNSYTSDTLEVLYWLAKADVAYQQEYEKAINLVITKMDESGKWMNENVFKNPMLVEIEAKNTFSKWLTFRACYVLKKFRNMTFG
jgi:hypothetical protein